MPAQHNYIQLCNLNIDSFIFHHCFETKISKTPKRPKCSRIFYLEWKRP